MLRFYIKNEKQITKIMLKISFYQDFKHHELYFVVGFIKHFPELFRNNFAWQFLGIKPIDC